MTQWAEDHRDDLLRLVEQYDAVLLRDFDGAASAQDFSSFVNSLGLGAFEMGCSAAPRTNVAPGVFTANEAPPTEPIPFHHEMAQCDDKPAYVMFFCEYPATSGGATPIIPSAAVVAHLREHAPDVADKLRELGVRYVRVLPEEDDPSSPIGKSWKTAFKADTREAAEAAMRAEGTSWTWLADGSVHTVTKPMAALVTHHRTGEEMFFNAVVAALTGWVDERNDPRKAIQFGDGSELDEAAHRALAGVAAYMREHRVAFAWRPGDVLILDNYKAMHSRETFAGPRRILASLWAEPPGEQGAGEARFQRVGLAERSVDEALPLRLSRGGLRLGRQVVEGAAKAALRLRGGAGGVGAKSTLTLRSGAKMPVVGLGLWKVPRGACAETVVGAIRAGYRHLDCACDYGNEAEVGEGIRRAIAEGLVTRADLWVTSKLWNTYHSREHVEPACRRTLSDLGLDYVDLYLVHFPIALKYVPFEERYPPEWIHDPTSAAPKMELARVPMQETWAAMEALVPLGLARNIGVCNFNTAGLRDLLSYATVPPAVLQVELHPYNQQPKLLRYCAEEGIAVTGFSPLGAGSYVELGMSTHEESALNDPQVASIAQGKRVSAAQVILKWALQRGISIVPKSTKPERLAQNIDLDAFELSGEEMATMAVLDKGRRYNDPGVFCLGMGAFCPIYD